jgi:hypothetical protein
VKTSNKSVQSSDNQTTVNKQQTIPMYTMYKPKVKLKWVNINLKNTQRLVIKGKYQCSNDGASTTMELGCSTWNQSSNVSHKPLGQSLGSKMEKKFKTGAEI